jgi:quinolinate synthase
MNLVLDELTAASPEADSTCSLENYLALPDHTMDARIAEARAKLGATTILLGHHYQRDEVIRFADATGDSYKLSKIAAEAQAKYIVFCGVHFMAESADVLSHDGQQVILPDLNAGCSMADMAEISQVEACWEVLTHFSLSDEFIPLTYMNSAAAIKAFCGERGGLVCTSSNARAAFEWAFARGKRILFLPDQHLGRNTGYAMAFRWKRWRYGTRGACKADKRSRPWPPAAFCFGRATARSISVFCPATWTRCAPNIPASRSSFTPSAAGRFARRPTRWARPSG